LFVFCFFVSSFFFCSAGKTRVIATHQIHWLHLADHIVVLRNGTIHAQGNFKQLTAQGVDFGPLVTASLVEEGSPATPAAPASPMKGPVSSASAAKVATEKAVESVAKKPESTNTPGADPAAPKGWLAFEFSIAWMSK
jgi:energy-coupling factor transporter ATP-binding protein EcfA2